MKHTAQHTLKPISPGRRKKWFFFPFNYLHFTKLILFFDLLMLKASETILPLSAVKTNIEEKMRLLTRIFPFQFFLFVCL